MNVRVRQFALPALLLALLVAPGLALAEDKPPAPVADANRIAELIRQLGADEFAAREKAQAELSQLGLEAFDALHVAQNHNDPEISLRARYLVRSMAVRWFQDSDSPDVVKTLKGYGDLLEGSVDRENRMDQLAALKNEAGIIALCRLARYETSEPLGKKAALKILGQPAIEDPAVRSSVAEKIVSIVGSSNRPSAQWLKLYARALAQPDATLSEWDAATKAEHTVLDHQPMKTSKEIVRDLYRYQIELLEKLGREGDMVEVTRRTFTLLEPKPEQLTEVIDWLMKRQAWDAVLELQGKFGDVFNDSPLLLYRVAETQAKLGKQDEAKATADKALALKAENLDEHFRVGYMLQEKGLHQWAEREFREVMKNTPAGAVLDFRARFYLSELLHDQGREAEAADALKPLCELMDKDEMAKETCVRALRDPEGVYSRMNFFAALAASESKDTATAEKLLDKAAQNDPLDADALIALYRLPNASPERQAKTKTLIEEAAKQFREQIEEFKQAAEQAPTEQFKAQANQQVAQECNQLAWLVGNTFGDFDEALAASHKSLELRPDYPGYLDTLGRCYYAKGDLENAVKYQSRAVELDPHSGQIRRQLEFFKRELAAKGDARNSGTAKP
jgi:tetratricopeptide (TPR) repeat protein